MAVSIGAHYLEDALLELRKQKRLAERAMQQLEDGDLFVQLDPEANSIAVLVKHMAGNMRSRWTDFLTTDGEKPDRDRDSEFVVEPGTTRGAVMSWWEDGWRRVFEAIEALGPDDLARTVPIRGEPHTVLQAINRQLTHYAQHVGQIVLLAKHLKGRDWQTLSIPRGQSRAYEVAKTGERRSM
jgi:uncharacterized Ntn-hydrolase superfamily protein